MTISRWLRSNCRFAQAAPSPATDTYDATDNYWKPEFKLRGRVPPKPSEGLTEKAPVDWGQTYTDVGHGDGPVTLWVADADGAIETRKMDSGRAANHHGWLRGKGFSSWLWQGRFDHATRQLSITPAPANWNKPLTTTLVDRLRKMFSPSAILRY